MLQYRHKLVTTASNPRQFNLLKPNGHVVHQQG
jgi:hypothetical protein